MECYYGPSKTKFSHPKMRLGLFCIIGYFVSLSFLITQYVQIDDKGYLTLSHQDILKQVEHDSRCAMPSRACANTNQNSKKRELAMIEKEHISYLTEKIP